MSEGPFKGKEGWDCRLNRVCKGYVLKDVPKALTSAVKLIGQSWHTDRRHRLDWTDPLCQSRWWAPGWRP